MKLSKILAMAWENITQRKLRTSLTTLGVVIGITAIIGLASLGEGFRLEVKERMQQGFELDVLTLIPGSFMSGLRGTFTAQELEGIRNITGVKLVAPLITLPQAKIYNQTEGEVNALTVAAVNFSEMTQMFPSRFVPVQEGGGEIPDSKENDTVVLGYKTCFLNETEPPLANVGDEVTMQIPVGSHTADKNLTVSAILSESGTSGITNFNYWAFIPRNTPLQLMGQEEVGYNIVLVQVSDPEESEQVADDIQNIFENPYAITILVPLTFIRQVDHILNIVQVFLMAIASISLLVAGVMIMNIMTVSVMERTREIGILKAIGAKSGTVLTMFLTEAVLIGVVGGFIGLFTGYGLSHVLAFVLSSFIQPQQRQTTFQTADTQRMTINPVFSPEWTIVAFVFAVVVCIIFGLYPARKASKLDPVEALRYE